MNNATIAAAPNESACGLEQSQCFFLRITGSCGAAWLSLTA
jgi:hypothetical protein